MISNQKSTPMRILYHFIMTIPYHFSTNLVNFILYHAILVLYLVIDEINLYHQCAYILLSNHVYKILLKVLEYLW